ncbi:PREDICTED: nuclear pore complex protein NUP1-like isoform X2 [Nelumbo nucifera]|uniref:Nuclear pore complex protein NUP1-like isoform X2 n=1 Tax=Nelumbo nucifera TaxID=4432 RepID=A0A1U8Q7D1_NELNU|nr:PREDICTED: nuclear pore complex protein NUP1-like isoform X2 [Nelumbo nucifera]
MCSNEMRDEINRLMELLNSRTVDVTVRDEEKRPVSKITEPVPVHDNLEPVPGQANKAESQRLLRGISTPIINSSVGKQILEEDVASPAELAKAYMGNTASKVSTLGLYSQALQEDAALISNMPFPQRSPGMSIRPRLDVRLAGSSGVSQNGYLTPRPRGRSAIYSMACSPYSRVHSSASLKGVESTVDGYIDPSTSSQRIWDNGTLYSGKQVSKRRSSVLDNDIGSVGPIRRIRQKTNLMTPSKSMGLSVPENALPLEKPKHGILSMEHAENGDSISGTSLALVPSQSSEMAQKIFEKIDKLVPSRKERSSELKLAISKDKAPTKLTLDMLHGQALRSMDDVGSSKLLPSIEGTVTSDCWVGSQQTFCQDSTSQKLNKVEENGPRETADKLAPKANGAVTSAFIKDVPSFKAMDSIKPNFVVNPPQMRQAFKMSAHEDFVELDDDSDDMRDSSILLASEKEKSDTPIKEMKATSVETETVEKSVVPSSEAKLLEDSDTRGTDTAASDGPTLPDKTNFTASVTSPPITIAQAATVTPPLPPLFNNTAPPKEPPSAPIFSFGSKDVDKPFSFTPSSVPSSSSELSGLKFGAQQGLRLETFSSPATLSSTTTEVVPKTGDSDKAGNGQKVADSYRKSEPSISSGPATENVPKTGDSDKAGNSQKGVDISSGASTSALPIFSFGTSNNNSGLSNGSVASTSFIFSSSSAPSLPVPSSSMSLMFTTSSTSVTSTTNSTTLFAATSPSISAATPSFAVAPVFQFGSSTSAAVAPSNSVLPPSTSGTECTSLEPKIKQASPFGSLTGSSFGTSSSFTGSSSGNIFAFGASATSSTTNAASSSSTQSQSCNIFNAATGTGSQFGVQVASGETGASPFTQSVPSHFGSSSSSPTFGLSGSSAFSSGSPVFGSTPAKLFDSSTAFGQSASTTVSSSSGASGIFGSTLQGSTSSIFGSSFSSTSSSVAGFSFGVSSGAASATGSVPMVFGSSIGPSSSSIFSFTSASTTTSASPTPSFPLFGAPSPPPVTFGTASPGNNDQMNMEDSMAEDTIQASPPAVQASAFSQPSTPPSNFTFGSPAPSATPPFFQFGTQQNSVAPQTSPFQAAGGSLDFAAGGSFSLGTGGGDKSNRRYIKARRDKPRKK